MNIQMNELYGNGIHDITSLFSDKFHEEWTWACLDIIDEIIPMNKMLELKIKDP
jgi:hypothetical protein